MSSESRTQAAVDALFLLPTSFLAVTGSPSTDGNSHVSPIVSILSSRQHSSALDSSSSTTLDSSSTALDSPSSPAPSQSVDVDTSSFQGLGTETPKDKGMRQKGKRFNMPEHRRIELFRRERLVGEVFPHAVWCKECQAWVALDKRRRFYMGMWEKHLKTYHLPVCWFTFLSILALSWRDYREAYSMRRYRGTFWKQERSYSFFDPRARILLDFCSFHYPYISTQKCLSPFWLFWLFHLIFVVYLLSSSH